MSGPKIVITGTGRAGTTLLIALLTDLGLDTGFPVGIRPDMHSGGLERNIERSTARVVKAPGLSTRLRPLLDAGKVEVEHVIVPVRDLDVAAASRVRVAAYGRRLGVPGGFTETRRAGRQRDVLAHMMYELVYTLTLHDVPHTFLLFPRFAHDWQYLHDKLRFLLPDTSPDDVRRAVEARYDPGEIREEPLSRAERARATALSPWSMAQSLFGRTRRRTPDPRS